METQAHANKRAGVEEGAERLTRQQLNQESNESQLMAARAKPGTTIPPYRHTTIPPLCGLMYMHVWSDVCGLHVTQRVLGFVRCTYKEPGHYGRQCIKSVPASKVKKGYKGCGKKHSFTGL
jgi:hypothetical protein